MTTTDGEFDALLKELDEVLAVSPAEDFAARVRGRIVAQAPAARLWRWRQDLAVAAAVLLVVGATRMIWDRAAESALQGRVREASPARTVAVAPRGLDVTLAPVLPEPEE